MSVEHFNLAQQPAAFADDAAVKQALETNGEAGLPLVKVNGEVKSSGTYPSREELAAWAGIGGPMTTSSDGAVTKKESTGCCGPAKAEASPSKEQASDCCGPSTKTDSSAAKNSGCC